MALMIKLPSACGRTWVDHDYYDDNWATHGACCQECVSIILCRWAWMDADYNFIP